MKTLIFVKNLNTEDDVKMIKEAFLESRIEYEINLENKCVIIFGRNDVVRAARILLAENGFIVS